MKQETFDTLFENSTVMKQLKKDFQYLLDRIQDNFLELHEMIVENDSELNHEIDELNMRVEEIENNT